ncbi:MAG: manganese efflux pump MntP family protein [Candidatus Marinimicrobia bacterium]|nr:manganese efflux pump MntP family protein [Candidatus Neomarinimicrobiota bacterium]
MLSMITVFGIAVGLAMDAFAVSISYGCGLRKFSLRVMLWVAFSFAVFQGGMTLIGYAAGSAFSEYIQAVDHFIAFGLLLFIGGKMIWEAFAGEENCELVDPKMFNMRRLLLLSVATSIDALAVGLSFALLEVRIMSASLIIALVTLAFSMIGVKAGHVLQKLFGRKIEIVGGIILIMIGIRILITHLQAA